jgi:hypothetical protein
MFNFLRRKKKFVPIWRTATGEEIPVKELSDEHLKNICRYSFRMALAVWSGRYRLLMTRRHLSPNGLAELAWIASMQQLEETTAFDIMLAREEYKPIERERRHREFSYDDILVIHPLYAKEKAKMVARQQEGH